MTPFRRAKTLRNLLTALGVGQFNATMVIPILFMAPATTDPRQPATIMLVRHLQRAMWALGAKIDDTGYLDEPTTEVIEQLLGAGWMNRPWSDTVNAVVTARQNKLKLATPAPVALPPEDFGPQATSGMGLFEFLPSVPGGALTYLAGAGLLYYFLTKQRRAQTGP
jgi:hypothetical protein